MSALKWGQKWGDSDVNDCRIVMLCSDEVKFSIQLKPYVGIHSVSKLETQFMQMTNVFFFVNNENEKPIGQGMCPMLISRGKYIR